MEKSFVLENYVEYRPSVKPVSIPLMRGPDFNELRSRILARQPLIFIDTYDREWLYSILAQVCSRPEVQESLGCKPRIFEHVAGLGQLEFETKEITPSVADVHDFLFQNHYQANDILLLHGHSQMFERPELVGWLRTIVGNDLNDDYGTKNVFGSTSKGSFLYVMIVGQNIQIPSDLIPYAVRMELHKPQKGAILKTLKALADKSGLATLVDAPENKGKIEGLSESLIGFSNSEVELILRYALQRETIEQCEEQILMAKREMIKRTGFLKLIDDKSKAFDQKFAGLEELELYLRKVGKLAQCLNGTNTKHLDLLEGYGLKGILLVGMPGCGKSMAAKAARLFINPNWPLIQLDIGRLLGKYVGESENNLRMALDIAERVSPCILWIDELEKAFSGLDSSDGTTLRLFGSFLTWMQEKIKPVYVIATANNIDRLPDEFKRKGRFDEIFRILLPNQLERAKIFEFQLQKFRKANLVDGVSDDGEFVLLCQALAKCSAYDRTDDCGFSGADIMAVVHSVATEAIVSCGKISEMALTKEIQRYRNMKLTQRDIMSRSATNGTDLYKKSYEMLMHSGFRPASKE